MRKNILSSFGLAQEQSFSGLTPKVAHFIGIGGIGVSALAQWFLAQNWAVSGSDITASNLTRQLQKLGIKVKIGHKKANIPKGCALVIHTQAIRPENVELKEARRRRITALSYPEAAGKLTEWYRTIAVAGAHGKSTATALVGLILTKAGLDPTVIVGTKLKEFSSTALSKYGSNFRPGKSKYLVLEADEYGKAFLHYSPSYAIVTNIDEEHLDFYKNLKNIKKSFLEFLSRIQNGGALILNRDSKILFSLKPAIEKIAKSKKLNVVWYALKNPEAGKIKKVIRISGKHNVSNALGAFCLSKILNVPEKTALRAIADYRGSWRRMEYRGNLKIENCKLKIPVYDDYAHHPTEIKATLQAFRERFPDKKIICVFQPHQAERLKILFKEFRTAFDEADMTLILPVYQVAGRDLSISPRLDGEARPFGAAWQETRKKFDSETLVKAIQKKYPKKLVFYLANPNNLKKALKMLLPTTYYLQLTPLLVMMGAGDIVKYTNLLLSLDNKSNF